MIKTKKIATFAVGLMALLMPATAPAYAGPYVEGSNFGKYDDAGIYDQYVRQSIYVKMPDGAPIAVDVFLPAKQGRVETKPLPTIFYYGRYWRAKEIEGGMIMTNLGPWEVGQKIGDLKHRDESGKLMFWDTGRESIVDLMRRGYAFVRAESRGTGASGGIRDGEHTLTEAKDGAALIKWISHQAWSDGKVGMIGGSYPGMTQLKVAALAPPALKAIFPAVPAFDFYQLVTGGTGSLHKGILAFGEGQAAKDGLTKGSFKARVVPIDADTSREKLQTILEKRKAASPTNALMAMLMDTAPEVAQSVMLLAQAIGEENPANVLRLLMSPPHLAEALKGRPELQEQLAKGLHLFRDTPAFSSKRPIGTVSPHAVLDQINTAGIPTYIWTGWYDQDTIGAFDLFQNLDVPKKITAGTWSHGPNEDNGVDDHPFDAYEAEAREILNAEAIRWFDYWLKDIQNGIMDEPAVHYSVATAPTVLHWNTAEKWKASGESAHKLYLGTSQRSSEIADGLLSSSAQKQKNTIGFQVDYTKTMGPQSRVHDSTSNVPAMRYPDLNAHASGEGSLTFETDTLSEDVLIAGTPELIIYAKSTAPDGDLFAYLEEVDADGQATYLTEAVVRASHSETGTMSYDTASATYSLSDRKTVALSQPFNSDFKKLIFTMQPTANLFEKGNRIRLVITGGDMHNYLTPVFEPAPQITLSLASNQAPVLTLPAQ